jgi:hypothetical protein
VIEEPEVERLPPRREDSRRAEERRFAPVRRRAAFMIAIAADVVQWIAFPIFMWGGASPLNDALDLVVAIVMIRLIGFHWAFLPAFLLELVPFGDFVPTWTAAVWLATRGSK